MQHIEWQELIPFYIAKSLSHEQHQAFDSHLVGCIECQHELESWRGIAEAVWEVTDASVQQLPPLSATFLERLPVQKPLTAPAPIVTPIQRPPLNMPARPRQSTSGYQLPVTMVAGTIVALFFGALLVIWGIGRGTNSDPTEVAIAPDHGDASDFGAPMQLTPTQAIIGDGILPTPTRDAVVSPTNDSNQTQLRIPTDTPDPNAMTMLSAGPYITLTPDWVEGDVHVCYLFNPSSTERIAGYEMSSFDSAISGYVEPNGNYRTYVRSNEGWYQIVVPDPFRPIWIPPSETYLLGNCEESVFWIPTPTEQSIPTETPDPSPAIMYVMVTAGNAPLYSAPDFSGEIVGGVEQGEILAVTAALTVEDARWLLVQTNYPTLGETWLSADLVEETSAP